MTQQELDKATETVNAANEQLRIAMDKLDVQKRIIETQDELIAILKDTLKNRDKYMATLESQLNIQDNVITKHVLKG
jgi:phage-related minor tail protein